nr:collagen alpha-1(I) chain [Oryctolagus cuniculus]
MAASALERSRRARPGARAAGAGRARGSRLPAASLGRAGPGGAERKASGSRDGVPLPREGGRGRGAGARGRRAPGAASPRGRARGAAGRGAGPGRRIRCSRRPPSPSAPAPGGGCGGGAREGRRPVLTRSGHGFFGIPGASAALTSPRNGSARARGHGRRPRAVSPGLRGPAEPGFLGPLLPESRVPPPPPRSGGEGHAPGARRVCAKPPPHSAPGQRQTSGRAGRPGPRRPPRPPGGAHCAPGPRGQPSPRPPDGPALRVGARGARREMHVNLEKVAGRAGRALRSRAWAPPGRRAFVFVRDKGPRRRRWRTRWPGPGDHSWARRGRSYGEAEPGGEKRLAARRGGRGAWAGPERRALRRVAGARAAVDTGRRAHRGPGPRAQRRPRPGALLQQRQLRTRATAFGATRQGDADVARDSAGPAASSGWLRGRPCVGLFWKQRGGGHDQRTPEPVGVWRALGAPSPGPESPGLTPSSWPLPGDAGSLSDSTRRSAPPSWLPPLPGVPDSGHTGNTCVHVHT